LAGDGKTVHAIASSLKDLMVEGKLSDKSLDATGRPGRSRRINGTAGLLDHAGQSADEAGGDQSFKTRRFARQPKLEPSSPLPSNDGAGKRIQLTFLCIDYAMKTWISSSPKPS
jgi:hypothetical protein